MIKYPILSAQDMSIMQTELYDRKSILLMPNMKVDEVVSRLGSSFPKAICNLFGMYATPQALRLFRFGSGKDKVELVVSKHSTKPSLEVSLALIDTSEQFGIAFMIERGGKHFYYKPECSISPPISRPYGLEIAMLQGNSYGSSELTSRLTDKNLISEYASASTLLNAQHTINILDSLDGLV